MRCMLGVLVVLALAPSFTAHGRYAVFPGLSRSSSGDGLSRSSSGDGQVGEKAPAMDVLKWYNTPPIAAEKMLGRAVLVEVFRTW